MDKQRCNDIGMTLVVGGLILTLNKGLGYFKESSLVPNGDNDSRTDARFTPTHTNAMSYTNKTHIDTKFIFHATQMNPADWVHDGKPSKWITELIQHLIIREP